MKHYVLADVIIFNMRSHIIEFWTPVLSPLFCVTQELGIILNLIQLFVILLLMHACHCKKSALVGCMIDCMHVLK